MWCTSHSAPFFHIKSGRANPGPVHMCGRLICTSHSSEAALRRLSGAYQRISAHTSTFNHHGGVHEETPSPYRPQLCRNLRHWRTGASPLWRWCHGSQCPASQCAAAPCSCRAVYRTCCGYDALVSHVSCPRWPLVHWSRRRARVHGGPVRGVRGITTRGLVRLLVHRARCCAYAEYGRVLVHAAVPLQQHARQSVRGAHHHPSGRCCCRHRSACSHSMPPLSPFPAAPACVCVAATDPLNIPTKDEILALHSELCDILKECSNRQAKGHVYTMRMHMCSDGCTRMCICAQACAQV